jgi:hypothetical protein
MKRNQNFSSIKQITCCGYKVEENKIQKELEKVQVVLGAPRSKSAKEVQNFLDMVTYYAKFLKDVLSVAYPRFPTSA